MISGIECAGLVIAVLPLVIEAGKLYARGTDKLLNVALHSRRDDKLQSFYLEFWWEITELGERIQQIVSTLPRLSAERKIALANVARLEDWNCDTDVDVALKTYFATEEDLNTFMLVMTKLMSLIAQLVNDRTTYVRDVDAVSDSSGSKSEKGSEWDTDMR